MWRHYSLCVLTKRKYNGATTMRKSDGSLKVFNFSPKILNIELSHDPAILLLGIYPKELKAETETYFVLPSSLIGLFTTVTWWKQLKCPSTNQYM